jgi:hypothetical protein
MSEVRIKIKEIADYEFRVKVRMSYEKLRGGRDVLLETKSNDGMKFVHLHGTRLAIGAGGGGGSSSLVFFDDFFLKSGNPFIVIVSGHSAKECSNERCLDAMAAASKFSCTSRHVKVGDRTQKTQKVILYDIFRI